jgi:hypothetical protein
MLVNTQTSPIRLGILGSGGLGRGMLTFLPSRPHIQWVAMADSQGYVYQADGLSSETLQSLSTVADWPGSGQRSEQAILDMLQAHGQDIDALFVALPNLPVGFYAEVANMIATQTPFKGVMVDALKRTSAVEAMMKMDDVLKANHMLYITGAGATPGLLTTAAAMAAQSFAEVLRVDINFGVGISNWAQYRATIREDFLHLKGFDTSRVMAMSDAEIEAELDARNGIIELVDMEHADDIILEMAGVCPRDRVHVGGVVDTRNAKKPVSTTVTIEGRTVRGDITRHVFTLADETSMTDNVCGTALGFLTAGYQMKTQYGMAGVQTSAALMPMRLPANAPMTTATGVGV